MSEFTSGYLIHSTPYKDTSVIGKIYTRHYGKISVIAKGIRRKKHKWRSFFTVFNPIKIEIKLSSKPEGLTQLYNVEQLCQAKSHDSYLITLSLFYLNELIHFLMPTGQADEDLFLTYHNVLQNITLDNIESNLRLFEFNLLESLGYGIHFECDNMHEALLGSEFYFIRPMSLPEKINTNSNDGSNVFSGETLIHLGMIDIAAYTPKMLKQIKYILRLNIDHLLQGRVLKSRELVKEYISMKGMNKNLETTPKSTNKAK